MRNRINGYLLLIIAGMAIVAACAKINSPTGGLKDKMPPKVVGSTPLNGAKNFKGKRVEISFDEYVVLDNINEKLIISPPVKKKPLVQMRGKDLVVEFADNLRDSSTYTLNFQDAIKDLNEGNILRNYQFVFATGSVIDTLSLTGNVYNSFDLEAPEKTQAYLYSSTADSAVQKRIPDYLTNVDLTGYFRINNIRPGKYRLYSIKDDDNSRTYNLPDEQFAYLDTAIIVTVEKNYIPPPKPVPDSTKIKKIIKPVAKTAQNKPVAKKEEPKVEEAPVLKGDYSLYQFTAPKKTHYLVTSKRDTKYHMYFILSLPPGSMRFDFSIAGAPVSSYFTEMSRARDTLNVWISDSSLYSKDEISTYLTYPFTDTLKITKEKLDTVLLRFVSPVRPQKNAKPRRVVLSVENNIGSGYLKPGQIIMFRSKTPFAAADTSKIKLYEQLEKQQKRMTYNLFRDSLNSGIMFMKADFAVGKKYFLLADKKSFSNIYKEYSDSAGIKFSVKEADTYSKLTMDITNITCKMIIQLLDKSEKILAERHIEKDGSVVFPLLDNGFYRVKAIYDLNGDGKWTTGDFAVHRQPEPVSYYKTEIELKTGWEAVQQWDLAIRNFKDPKLVEKKKSK